jgi:hypothetical protein
MKRTVKIVAGALGTILIIGATLKGYIAISPWHIGTSVFSAKAAIAIFLLCSMFPYMLASGLLHSGEEAEVPAYESGAPLSSFAADDERSSNMTRTVAAFVFAVIVMGFCIFFPLLAERIFR